MLSFQGAGGFVEFDEYRSVSTPVEIFWILENGTEKRVGIYNPLVPSDFHVDIYANNLSIDTVSPIYKYVFIQLSGAIPLYILNSNLIIFTTIQLIFYLYYRHHKIFTKTPLGTKKVPYVSFNAAAVHSR